MTVRLSNASALGVHRYDWASKFGAAQCSVQWAEGMGLPLAFMGQRSAEVRNPERFGFTRPVTAKNFRAFAQAFADAFEEGPDDDE
jgi:hypothetical protein